MIIKDIKKKLKSGKGESLAEVLITILLVGIVSSGFLVVVETANGMSKKAMEVDKGFFESMNEIESQIDSGSTEEGEVVIEMNSAAEGSNTFTLKVDKVTGSNGMASYRLKKDDLPDPNAPAGSPDQPSPDAP